MCLTSDSSRLWQKQNTELNGRGLISESGLALGFSVHEGVLLTVCESFVFQSLFGDLGSGIGIFFVFRTLLHHNIYLHLESKKKKKKTSEMAAAAAGVDRIRSAARNLEAQSRSMIEVSIVLGLAFFCKDSSLWFICCAVSSCIAAFFARQLMSSSLKS